MSFRDSRLDPIAAAMTKEQVLKDIEKCHERRKAAWAHKTAIENEKQRFIDAAMAAARERIWKQAKRQFDQRIEKAKKAYDEAGDAALALRIQNAALLAGVPVNCVLEEWRRDWVDDVFQWVRTGRKGKAEVFLHGTEWPRDKHHPDIGNMFVRILGKKGQPTQAGEYLTRQDSQYRKYKWEPCKLERVK